MKKRIGNWIIFSAIIFGLHTSLAQSQMVIDGVYFGVGVGDSVKIPGNLTIRNRGHLQIPVGGRTHVTGNLLLKADIDTVGSNRIVGSSTMIDLGALTVNGSRTYQCAILSDRWHYISIPVATFPYDVSAGQPFAQNNNLYYYNEAGSGPRMRENWVQLSDDQTMYKMVGYDLFFGRNKIIPYTGLSNNGNQSISLTFSKIGKGWNLVGNPYPSYIDWDAASGWTKSDVWDAIYFNYNNNIASYVDGIGTLGATSIISPMQGFFVLAKNAGTLAMTNNVRVWSATAAATNYYKSGEIAQQILKITLGNDSLNDEAYLRFTEAATTSFDGSLDAIKLFSFSDSIPQVYTLTNAEPYAINSIPPIEENSRDSIWMGVHIGAEGLYTLSFDENKTGLVSSKIILEDKYTQTFTELTQNNKYIFTSEAASLEDRFLLHFNNIAEPIDTSSTDTVTFLPEVVEKIVPKLYAYRQSIYVRFPEQPAGEYHLELYNLQGQMLIRTSISGDMEIPTALNGIYIARLVSSTNMSASKIILRP